MRILINIVRNGSFEQHFRCPVTLDQIKFANYWSPIDTAHTYPALGDTFGVPYCTPDYVNACAMGNYDVGAPNNSRFYQYPRTGNGMVQVQMFFDESASVPYKRDYLQGKLYKNLTAGKTYCITFYINFEGTATGIPCGYAVDHIGAYLDNGSICQDTGMNFCGLPKPSITPQVYATTIIADTVNWIKIQGSFIANGTEKFITIGNFFDKAHTNYISYSNISPFSWYLVDDVSVIESTAKADAGLAQVIEEGDSVHIGTNEEGMPCTWYVAGDTTPVGYSGGIWVKPDTTTTYVVEMDLCGNVTKDSVRVWVWPLGTKPLTPKGEPAMWPNPVNNELHVSSAAGSVFSVYDITGREVYKQVISSESEIINIESLQKGIYLIHVVDPVSGVRVTRKIVKE